MQQLGLYIRLCLWADDLPKRRVRPDHAVDSNFVPMHAWSFLISERGGSIVSNAEIFHSERSRSRRNENCYYIENSIVSHSHVYAQPQELAGAIRKNKQI